MIRNVNVAMVNVPVQNVKRENLAIATVIVNAVRKNAVALNKIELLKNHQLLSRGGVFCLYPHPHSRVIFCRFGNYEEISICSFIGWVLELWAKSKPPCSNLWCPF